MDELEGVAGGLLLLLLLGVLVIGTASGCASMPKQISDPYHPRHDDLMVMPPREDR